MKDRNNILWGVILILLGLLIALRSLGVLRISPFFTGWWTLFIIIPSFVGLFKERDKTGSIIGLLIGISLLLGCNKIIDFSMIWKLALPVILVILGLSLMFKENLDDKIADSLRNVSKKSDGKEYCATFSSQSLSFDGEVFKGSTLTAVFGEIKCDLRNAKIDEDVMIRVSTIFGGSTLYIPKNVNVVITSNAIFGGVNGKNRKLDENKRTIFISATCLFGGVEIK